MTIKAVLFDIDGTLVDSNDYHVEAWQDRAVQFYQLKRNLARASKPARAAAYLSCRTELA